MIYLLMALALFPAEIAVEGAPGEHLRVPLTIISEGDVRIEGTDTLRANQEVEIGGKKEVIVETVLNSKLEPGNYQTYLYVIPEQEGPVIPGAGVKIKAKVTDASAKIVPGTETSFKNPLSWPLIALGSLVFLAGLALSIKVKKD